MKLIRAYVRPSLLEDVYSALNHNSYCCMTVFKGEGTGAFINENHQHSSLDFQGLHTEVVKVEMVSNDDHVEEIVDLIQEHGSTGHQGDGIICIQEVGQAIRVRDGEKGHYIL